jgi:hypothetical protein
MRQSFYRVYESSLLKEKSVVSCWFLVLEKAVVKRKFRCSLLVL